MGFVGTAFRMVALFGTKVAGAVGAAAPATELGAFALGAGTLGAGAYAGKTLLSSLSPDAPQVPSLTSSVGAAPTIEQARETSRDDTLDLLRKKRAGTTLTTPQGLLTPSEVTGKTLLGS